MMGSVELNRTTEDLPVFKLRSVACTKARKLPGVRCCMSSTTVTSLLYLMAIPLRRSFADGIRLTSHDFEFRQVLRIHDSYRPSIVVHHNQIVNLSLLKNLQRFDRQFVLTNGNRIARHDGLDLRL